MEDKKPEAKVIKANYVLQAKVGSGPLDAKTVSRCQDVIDNNTVDFSPLAKEFLDKLKAAIDDAKNGNTDLEETKQAMTQPVMELKANAKIFKYDLIGNLANVMLSFLEAIKTMDNHVIEIVNAHHKTLMAIIANKMSGDGGANGKKLEQELKDACKRYFQAQRK